MLLEENILTPAAVSFLNNLVHEFREELQSLLESRRDRQTKYDAGALPNYVEGTEWIRHTPWKVAPIPNCLLDRRVEITCPPDRKMIINALNSGAKVFMADFEDSLSPTWPNILKGQKNLKDAVRRTITYEHPTKGTYTLNEETAVIFVRPRGLHLTENHHQVKGQAIPASLFDFGLFMFHNAQELIDRGYGPYFYLPKLEDRLEARWWNKVFNWTQDFLSIPRGTIRATVLLETLPAAFQMNEILYELRDHSAGLNCGRWDYIFSYIKTLKNHSDKVLPDRSLVTMQTAFMHNYAEELVKICHRRGVHAMGGMAAQIPIRGDEEANSRALEKVKTDKIREVKLGHDGTWVAHPGLVDLALQVFDEFMPESNQINKIFPGYHKSQADLTTPPEGAITTNGLLQNVLVGVKYIEAWLCGNGCVPINNLMEDAATAEISRTQVWQWIKHSSILDDGRTVTIELFDEFLDKAKTLISYRENHKFKEAFSLFRELSTSNELCEFLTLPAYKEICND